jgi:hypothetical protein
MLDAVGARLDGRHSEQTEARAGWRAAQHPVLEHAQDQGSAARVAVAVAVEILALQAAADVANFLEDAIDMARHQLARLFECRQQPRVGDIYEVPEDMNGSAALPPGGKFNPWDDLQFGWCGRVRRFDARKNVVIGDRDGAQAAFDGGVYDFGGRQPAVRGRGVHMQVDV